MIPIERLSTALAPHRVLTRVPRMDQWQLIDRLFDAIKPDFAHLPASAWEKAKADTIRMEQGIAGVMEGGLGLLQPFENAGAPGADWLCAVACSEEGIQYKSPRWDAPLVHFVVLTLNPSEPKGVNLYLRRIRTISLLCMHATDFGRAQSADELISRLREVETIRFGTYGDRYTIQMRMFWQWMRRPGSLNVVTPQFAHFEGILKQTPFLLEYHYPSEYPLHEKETDGYWLGFRDGQVCPVDRAMLWYFDSWLELASGRKGFPAQELNEAERAEVVRLREARIAPKNERESHPPPISTPFQCFEGHRLWLDPNGGIRARPEASVVDKTVAYAAEKLGLPLKIPN